MISVWPVSVEQGNLGTRLSLKMRILENPGADKKVQGKRAAYSGPAQWLEKSPVCRQILNCRNYFLQHSEVSASAVTGSPKGIETVWAYLVAQWIEPVRNFFLLLSFEEFRGPLGQNLLKQNEKFCTSRLAQCEYHIEPVIQLFSVLSLSGIYYWTIVCGLWTVPDDIH